MKYEIISLTPELLEKIQKLADLGFSRSSIMTMTGVPEANFDLWLVSGAASSDIPAEQRQKNENLYADFFNAVKKAPGETIYTKDNRGNLQIR